ncbi:Dabb family protein [Microbacterium sp. NPDC077663]|uniref:Dabb family protein n=1 Tax=Microbacterium sp. NPDC077663 TaxID=3364189 RepID=UPI0037C5E8BD
MLFRIHDDVEEHDVDAAIDALRSLADLPCVESWHIARSLDDRKGRILIEEATFADETAFAVFRADPRHREAAAQMAGISDWWIGDYRV